jgi:hypothetical protein
VLSVGLVKLIRRRAALGRRGSTAIAAVVMLLGTALASTAGMSAQFPRDAATGKHQCLGHGHEASATHRHFPEPFPGWWGRRLPDERGTDGGGSDGDAW